LPTCRTRPANPAGGCRAEDRDSCYDPKPSECNALRVQVLAIHVEETPRLHVLIVVLGAEPLLLSVYDDETVRGSVAAVLLRRLLVATYARRR
jgi:hypothetical protein